ncbi:transmembrane protein 106B-like [Parambassis ranga]|uniref:Transmembrane protein 106B-like n=1 Tax=Parambassis ranga TaxID=210632 RepID=A0A6P7IQE2_9TELE|nr:transmembrane protein 106B-like [Parambassis ranga]XP_028267301.1 transmembrane protein 106B-like [Parambassis ranga]XP_028267302.1 transmembrane protein 106B-like [Parambassis ranga]
MGVVSSKCDGVTGSLGVQHSESGQDNEKQPIIEKDAHKRRSSSRRHSSGETVDCPTCQGTGRIPRGQESKLVAVIPCNDQRLRPRHTKLYVAASVGVCFLVSTLVLFFLFPRSVILSPVAVASSFVYFTETDVQINITNVLNITNKNFAEVQTYNLTVQALNVDTVVGTVTVKNVTSVKPLSIKTYSFMIPVKLTDPGLSNFCRNPSFPVHILYLHLQMSLTVYYLAHYEQLSVDTYEYIDCGANTTIPHNIQHSPT